MPTQLCLEALESRWLPTLLGNSLFPADNPWNQAITHAPVAANSATLVASIGATRSVHPDFGAALYNGSAIGIPFNVVPGTQPTVPVVIDAYASESDLRPIPIPTNAVIEGDPLSAGQNTGDRHLLVYDKDNNVVYETFNTHRPSEEPDGRWHADSEAVWDLKQNTFRTPDFTSADAAGLPILPGLVRPDEVLDQHRIDHAIRFTVPRSRNAYVFPASHQAGVNDASLPRMGERFRLKATFDISSFSPANQVILQALKDYGMIVADNGSGWYLSGEPSARWDDNDLHNLGRVIGNNFEAVDLTPIVSGLGQASGSTNGGGTLVINGQNFAGAAGRLRVFFGSVAATGIQVLSDSQVSVTVPAHTAGTFAVSVQTPYGTSATGTASQYTFVTPIPQAGVLQFSSAAVRVSESAGSVTLTVTRTSGNTGAVAVGFQTATGTAGAADFTSTSGTLNFADGEVSKTIQIPILNDSAIEGNETFRVQLGNATGGATLGSPVTTIVTIQDDDGTKDQRWVATVYLDLLNRPADAAGLTYWTARIGSGISRGQIAQEIEGSTEYRRLIVQGIYQSLLHRSADSAGLNYFTNLLSNGGTIEQVQAQVAGSVEYYRNRGGGTNDGFLDALYQDALQRAVDPTGRTQFDQALTHGALPSQVAAAIFGSDEYRQDLVRADYLRYLHRPADTTGLNLFVTALRQGARDQDVLAAMLGSAEYYGQV